MGPFGSLSGGNDYGYGQDRGQAVGNLDSAGSNYGAETVGGLTNMSNWGQDNNAYRQSMTNLAQQYGQAPTEQQEAQVLGNENADVATAYGKARAQLMSDSASRGLDTVGNQGSMSSTLGGGLASLGQSYANTLANNATNYYNQYQSPQATDARLAQQGGIYGQLASADWSQGMGALNDAAQGYAGLGQDWSKMADDAGQMDEANSQMWSGLLDPMAGGVGKAMGDGNISSLVGGLWR
jgi:hypothetical protein